MAAPSATVRMVTPSLSVKVLAAMFSERLSFEAPSWSGSQVRFAQACCAAQSV
jgi:hypothetical protein